MFNEVRKKRKKKFLLQAHKKRRIWKYDGGQSSNIKHRCPCLHPSIFFSAEGLREEELKKSGWGEKKNEIKEWSWSEGQKEKVKEGEM